jgi:hypothetical protein
LLGAWLVVSICNVNPIVLDQKGYRINTWADSLNCSGLGIDGLQVEQRPSLLPSDRAAGSAEPLALRAPAIG